MVTNDKEEFIDIFLKAIKQDGRVLKYISEEDVKNILAKQISIVEYEDIEVENWMGAYDGTKKKVICKPEYKGNIPIIIHELFHALTNNMQNPFTLGEQSVVMKSGLHFFYRGENKKWYDRYEIGRGLDEGITQYLARHIAGIVKSTNLLSGLGLDIVKDISYPGEQQIVEELVAIYGENIVLGSYFETSPQRLIEAIGESEAIKNPQIVLTEIMQKLDILEIFERTGVLMHDDKSYKKEFSKIQKFISKELIEKEIRFALKSKDIGALTRVKQILENLQELGVFIDGKNVFENVTKFYNDEIQRMPNGNVFMVAMNPETQMKKQVNLNFSEKIQVYSLKQQKGIIKFAFATANRISRSLLQMEKKIQKKRLMNKDKNVFGLISAPRPDVEVNQSGLDEEQENIEEQKREAILAAIRGCSKEEYEKSCKEAEQAWTNKKNEDRDTRSSQMDR